jgi:hypothetical protein
MSRISMKLRICSLFKCSVLSCLSLLIHLETGLACQFGFPELDSHRANWQLNVANYGVAKARLKIETNVDVSLLFLSSLRSHKIAYSSFNLEDSGQDVTEEYYLFILAPDVSILSRKLDTVPGRPQDKIANLRELYPPRSLGENGAVVMVRRVAWETCNPNLGPIYILPQESFAASSRPDYLRQSIIELSDQHFEALVADLLSEKSNRRLVDSSPSRFFENAAQNYSLAEQAEFLKRPLLLTVSRPDNTDGSLGRGQEPLDVILPVLQDQSLSQKRIYLGPFVMAAIEPSDTDASYFEARRQVSEEMAKGKFNTETAVAHKAAIENRVGEFSEIYQNASSFIAAETMRLNKLPDSQMKERALGELSFISERHLANILTAIDGDKSFYEVMQLAEQGDIERHPTDFLDLRGYQKAKSLDTKSCQLEPLEKQLAPVSVPMLDRTIDVVPKVKLFYTQHQPPNSSKYIYRANLVFHFDATKARRTFDDEIRRRLPTTTEDHRYFLENTSLLFGSGQITGRARIKFEQWVNGWTKYPCFYSWKLKTCRLKFHHKLFQNTSEIDVLKAAVTPSSAVEFKLMAAVYRRQKPIEASFSLTSNSQMKNLMAKSEVNWERSGFWPLENSPNTFHFAAFGRSKVLSEGAASKYTLALRIESAGNP